MGEWRLFPRLEVGVCWMLVRRVSVFLVGERRACNFD